MTTSMPARAYDSIQEVTDAYLDALDISRDEREALARGERSLRNSQLRWGIALVIASCRNPRPSYPAIAAACGYADHAAAMHALRRARATVAAAVEGDKAARRTHAALRLDLAGALRLSGDAVVDGRGGAGRAPRQVQVCAVGGDPARDGDGAGAHDATAGAQCHRQGRGVPLAHGGDGGGEAGPVLRLARELAERFHNYGDAHSFVAFDELDEDERGLFVHLAIMAWRIVREEQFAANADIYGDRTETRSA